MDKQRIKELVFIAESWAEETLDSWFREYGAWDDKIESGELTEEELEWIQDNIYFIIETRETV